MAYALYLQDNEGQDNAMMIVLGQKDVERISKADPFVLEMSKVRHTGLQTTPMGKVKLFIAIEDDIEKLKIFGQNKDTKGLLEYLQRGHSDAGKHGPEHFYDPEST